MIYKINILHLKTYKPDSCQTKLPNFGVIGLILSDVYTSYLQLQKKLALKNNYENY